MRVGLLLDAYKPVVNGITNLVALLKRALEAAGHEPYVFTWRAGGYVDDEPNVVRSPALIPLGATGYALAIRYSRSAQALLQTMDVIHVHHPFIGGTLALRYMRPRGVPIVYTNHTRYDLYARHYGHVPAAVGDALVGGFLARFCARCDLVVAPAAGLAGVLRGLGVTTPITVIGNGVDLARFAAERRTLTRAELGLGADDCVLVFTGRLGPEKNLRFLLAAFAAACASHPRLDLLMVGGGPEAGALRRLAGSSGIGDRVHFTGPVAYDRIPAYLMLADAFVTASTTEVQPLSVIEALAAGLPVLALDAPGVRDVVVNGDNGRLCSGDEAVLGDLLASVAGDGEQRARLADGARRCRGAFDITTTAARYLGHYRDLAARARRMRGTA